MYGSGDCPAAAPSAQRQHPSVAVEPFVLMRFATGKVVRGKAVVEGPVFPQGAVVTMLMHKRDDVFDICAELACELEIAPAEEARGEPIQIAEALARLHAR